MAVALSAVQGDMAVALSAAKGLFYCLLAAVVTYLWA